MSVSYSAYQPSGQLGSKLEHVIITFQKNEIPLFGRAVEVVGWQSIFIVILCTLKQPLCQYIGYANIMYWQDRPINQAVLHTMYFAQRTILSRFEDRFRPNLLPFAQ